MNKETFDQTEIANAVVVNFICNVFCQGDMEKFKEDNDMCDLCLYFGFAIDQADHKQMSKIIDCLEVNSFDEHKALTISNKNLSLSKRPIENYVSDCQDVVNMVLFSHISSDMI